MNPTKIRCPHCGNSILVKHSGKTQCSACGSVLYVEEQEKSVQINVNGQVNYGRRMSPELFVISMVLCAVASIFFIFLPMLSRSSRKAEPKEKAHYATTLTDPVLVRAFTDVFEKDPSAWTADDYASVKEISFQMKSWTLLYLDVSFADDSKKRIPIYHDTDTVELDGTAFQVFPNLEALRAASGNTGDDVRISFDSTEYTPNLGNLKKLKILYLPNNGGYQKKPDRLAELVADPGAIEEIGGVALTEAADVDELAKHFPNLKTLFIDRREADIPLSGLRTLSKLEELGTDLDTKSNEDLPELSQVKRMQLRVQTADGYAKDLRFLSSLTQLDSLSLVGADEMKNLNMIAPLTNLKELRIYGGSALRSIEPLRALTELRTLDFENCYGIEDLSALSSLTKLQSLHVADSVGHFTAALPDLSALPALEELTAEADMIPQFAGCTGLKKLTIEAEGADDSNDFSLLAGLSNLEELRIDCGIVTSELTNIDSLAVLPNLKTVTVTGRTGPLSLRAFPHATEITVIMNSTGTAALRLTSELDSDNTALESLRIFGYEGGVQIGGYNSTVRDTAALMQLSHCKALRELRLQHCGLTDLAFASGLSNLEILDVSGNRIEDVSPLTDLPKLRLLLCADNAIQNIAVLRGRDLVVSE